MEYLTLGILAHVDAGKTTLCERLLYQNNATKNFGRVDKGESFLDYDELERKRGITIFSKEAIMPAGDKEITLLDTPGHVDFVWETLACFEVMDAALLIIDASSRVSVHTKRLYSLLKKNHIPVFIFLNKMDLSRENQNEIFARIQEMDSVLVDFDDNRDKLYENIALCDEEVLEEYLETGAVSDESIKNAISDCKLVPVYSGSALSGEGVEKLNKDIINYLSARKHFHKDFLPYKTGRDPKGNRIIYGRVLERPLQVKGLLQEEKIEELYRINGNKFVQISEAKPGMMVALRGPKNQSPHIKGVGAYNPLMEYEFVLQDDSDLILVMKQIEPLIQENPILNIRLDANRKRILLSPMGEIQLEILRDIIDSRFAISVDFKKAGVVYKETVTTAVEGVGHYEPLRHYAEAHILLEPNPGGGIEIKSRMDTDFLASNWQSQILNAIRSTRFRGTGIGAELIDFKATLVAGKAHEKHTEGGDFREATIRAVRQGLMQAGTGILGPLYSFEAIILADLVGKVMTRLEMMGASCNSPEYSGENVSITGTFPADKLEDFPAYLSSISGGGAELSLGFGGYALCENPEEIIAESSYIPQADLEQSPDSVFTSGGAAVLVPWHEVYDKMHLPLATIIKDVVGTTTAQLNKPDYTGEMFIGTEEIDRIIGAAGGQNQKRHSQDRRSHWNRYSKGESVYDGGTAYTAGKVKPIDNSKSERYLLVDGYNVIFAWENLKELSEINIDSAKDFLLDVLSEYTVFSGEKVILVFDAYKVSGGIGSITREKGVDVIYTREAETADAYIEKASRSLAKDYRVRVVTSDRLEQMVVWGDGSLPVSALDFYGEIQKMREDIAGYLNERRGQ